MDVIDNVLRFKLSPAPSLATIPAPSRVLDLGCGTGGWAIQAARAWPNAEVVGFDLVNVQINLACVEPSVARRITWQHGNFLSTRLPFEDDYFEHVHIQSISKGVPEHKWSSLFQEIHRVLTPAGSVEIIEDDIIFPVLPRWFTEPLRAKAERSSAIQPTNGTHSEPIPSPPSSPRRPPHEHALLELLFKSVYESRFINLKPTAVLPIYFTPFFSQCLSGSPMILPVPFLAPLPPLPEYTPSTQPDTLDRLSMTVARPQSPPRTRPSSQSFSSSASVPTLSSASTFSEVSNDASLRSVVDSENGIHTPTLPHMSVGDGSSPTLKERPSSLSSSHRESQWLSADKDGTTLDSSFSSTSIFPPIDMQQFSDRTRAMNLYRTYMGVVGCKEEMWGELKMLRTSRHRSLSALGWEEKTLEDKVLEDQEARGRFDEMFERFESDMLTRIAFWYSLTELGYPLPRRDSLIKSELLEEERLRKAIIESYAAATDEDFEVPSRVFRVFIGFKAYEAEEDEVSAEEK